MAMSEKEKEDIISILTRLLIENDFYERDKGVQVYIPKRVIYNDLIKMIKEILWKSKNSMHYTKVILS